jgi:hypothetical protein
MPVLILQGMKQWNHIKLRMKSPLYSRDSSKRKEGGRSSDLLLARLRRRRVLSDENKVIENEKERKRKRK